MRRSRRAIRSAASALSGNLRGSQVTRKKNALDFSRGRPAATACLLKTRKPPTNSGRYRCAREGASPGLAHSTTRRCARARACIYVRTCVYWGGGGRGQRRETRVTRRRRRRYACGGGSVTLVPARNQVTCIKLTYIPLSFVLSPLIKHLLAARLCR